MVDDPLGQELVVHLYAPTSGPHAVEADRRLRGLWSRLRELGAVHTIAGTELPDVLPDNLRTSRTDHAVAALENATANVQIVLRRTGEVLNLSLMFATAFGDRRPRMKSALPSGWIELDRAWRRLAGEELDSFLGIALVFQAERPPGVGAVPLASLPERLRDEFAWCAVERRGDGLSVWDVADSRRIDRNLVVLAQPDHYSQLSAWTWSRGDAAMPPLARYLMHSAELTYSIRVWRKDLAVVDGLRRKMDEQVGRMRTDPSHVADLRDGELGIAMAMSALRRLRQTARVARLNMAATFGEPLSSDRGVAEWFCAQVDHTLAQLEESRQLSREVRELVPSDNGTVADRDHVLRDLPSRTARRIRIGFMLDATGYGSRTTRAKERVQERLATLIRRTLDDLHVRPSSADGQGTGDGVLLFLPDQLDVQRALPVLLHSTLTHLTNDNTEFQDRLRLRMAVDIGPVSVTRLGFGGATATHLGRLLNSRPLRDWLVDHPGHDLAVLVSDRLHSFVITEDVPGLPPAQFRRVSLQVKEFATFAWLWTHQDPSAPPTARHQVAPFPPADRRAHG